jgi:hypothetical protein
MMGAASCWFRPALFIVQWLALSDPSPRGALGWQASTGWLTLQLTTSGELDIRTRTWSAPRRSS